MIHALLAFLILFWTQSPNSTLILVVRDGADQPVPGLTLTLMGVDGIRQVATTDASGQATFALLHDAAVTLTEVRTMAGQHMRLDPTTPKDGLVLGLMPNTSRTVLLRLDDGLVFLDPTEVFAGTDDQIGAAAARAPESLEVVPTRATAPTAPALGAVEPVAAATPPDLSNGPIEATLGLLLWCFVVPSLCLVCLIVFVGYTRRWP